MGGKGSGRIPRPAGLKLVEGRSEGRDSGGRKVATPPPFRRVPPQAPDDLDTIERQEWDRVVAEHEAVPPGLKNADHAALLLHCQLLGLSQRAYAQWRQEGITSINPESGRAHKNPAVSTFEAAARLFLVSAAHFGCTPSSEQRLGELTGDGGESNPFDWDARFGSG
jgi:P27 family predicted phage terminase small subunit